MSNENLKSIYELPQEYDESYIKLMAKDPHSLFAYWEISENSISLFRETFGQELEDKSVPVLKITNLSSSDYFFVRINDFSKNWYINTPDAGSTYLVEIGRKISDSFFINIASSNMVTTPSDGISHNTSVCFADYRKVKTGEFKMPENETNEKNDYIFDSTPIYGQSSPELHGFSMEESISGISSAELL